MKESDFSKKFIDAMKQKFPHMWAVKIHGHDMQQKFIPDNLFCINGKLLAIEFKIQRDNKISITPGQIKEISKIKNANGCGLIVAYNENNHRILIREKRLDWKIATDNKKYINIDWDFEFVVYENAVDLIWVMLED